MEYIFCFGFNSFILIKTQFLAGSGVGSFEVFNYIVNQNKKDIRQQAADSTSSTARRSNAVDFLFWFTITIRYHSLC